MRAGGGLAGGGLALLFLDDFAKTTLSAISLRPGYFLVFLVLQEECCQREIILGPCACMCLLCLNASPLVSSLSVCVYPWGGYSSHGDVISHRLGGLRFIFL